MTTTILMIASLIMLAVLVALALWMGARGAALRRQEEHDMTELERRDAVDDHHRDCLTGAVREADGALDNVVARPVVAATTVGRLTILRRPGQRRVVGDAAR